MEKLREETIRDIRCCLVIVKGSLEVTQLARDYTTFSDRMIPFKRLGYDTLEEFLRSIETLVVRRANGQIFVDAKPDPRSAHISQMVQRQKPAKKKPPKKQYNSMSDRRAPQRWRPNNVVQSHNNLTPRPYFTNSPRIEQHNQFVTTNRASPPSPRPYIPKNALPPTPQNKPQIHERIAHSGAGAKPLVSPTRNSKPELERLRVEAQAAIRACGSIFKTNTNIPKVTSASVASEKELSDFARILKLGEPDIKVLLRKTKDRRKRPQFDCKIKIDGIIYSSYPGDYHDAKSATQQASSVAMQALIDKYGGRGELLPVATEASITERIPSLVGKHINGVWSWQVEADYKDFYRETLPSNWLQIMKKRPGMNIEQFGEKFVMQVIRPKNKTEKEIKELACEVSIPTTTANFDEKGYMTAKIICPVSAGEIWCRQLGTKQAESFHTMSIHMNAHYQEMYNKKAIQNKSTFVVGSYYAVWEQTWHRARVLDVRDDGVVCQFVDRGEDLIVEAENIFSLDRIYAYEPAQAFVCKLAGLDDVYDVECPDAIMELEGSEVTLEVVDNDDDEAAEKIFSVVMYDFGTGVACNKDLLILIAIEDAKHNFEVDDTHEVCVPHIGNSGLFFVQIRTQGYRVLQNLVPQLEAVVPKYLDKHKTLEPITRANSKGKLYFAKLKDDAKYHRVQIIDSPENFQYAQILYVDIGRTCIVKMSDVTLIALDKLSPSISKFPAQATMVRMHVQHIPDDLPTKMKEYLSLESNVLLRVQSKDADGIPNVMLFVPHVNGLVSINDSLTISMGKYNKDNQLSPQNMLTPPPSPNTVPSTGPLKGPRVPSCGQSFLVKVPIAANPWSFFVQPLESTSRLNDMMAKMRETFANNLMDSVGLKDIKEGSIYAAKGNDDNWYRVCVLKAIYPTAIVVFYVDYGNYTNLCYQQLFLLDQQFLELPYQALKAKLSGIKPIQEKWSVDDGRYFENMVQQREYMATIISHERDELNPCDTVLVMKLRSNQNLFVDDWLIQKKLAAKN